jgi:hypothetical protein
MNEREIGEGGGLAAEVVLAAREILRLGMKLIESAPGSVHVLVARTDKDAEVLFRAIRNIRDTPGGDRARWLVLPSHRVAAESLPMRAIERVERIWRNLQRMGPIATLDERDLDSLTGTLGEIAMPLRSLLSGQVPPSEGLPFSYSFRLGWTTRCLFESELSVVRDPEGYGSVDGFGESHGTGTRTPLPPGFAALVDAEGELVAFVPDRPGLVEPTRMLPELLRDLLDAADCAVTCDGEVTS